MCACEQALVCVNACVCVRAFVCMVCKRKAGMPHCGSDVQFAMAGQFARICVKGCACIWSHKKA